MLLSAMSVLVVAQSSSEIPEGLMNNPVFLISAGLVAVACFLPGRPKDLAEPVYKEKSLL